MSTILKLLQEIISFVTSETIETNAKVNVTQNKLSVIKLPYLCSVISDKIELF